MTIKQQRYFFELCHELDFDKEEMIERARKKYGDKPFTDITTQEMSILIELLEQEQANQPVTVKETPSDKMDPIVMDFPDFYRVWDRAEEKMIYDLTVLDKISWEKTAETDRWHWMQWTGKYVGKEKVYDFDFIQTEKTKSKYLVQWSWPDCAWVARHEDSNEKILLCLLGEFRCLGSVYDNIE